MTTPITVFRSLAGVIAFAVVIASGGWRSASEEFPLAPAFAAWEKGDIEEAEKLARTLGGSDEGRHLLLLCDFVKGKYEQALEDYAMIDPGYDRFRELAEPAAASYFHLGRYADALRLAREFKVMREYYGPLAAMAERPFQARLDRVAVVPFAEHDMAEYFPGFAAELNGRKVIAHLDTGGAFMYMGPHRARELGIKSGGAGLGGFHGWALPVGYSFGMADSLDIGEARMENVPVMIVSTLVGPQDFIIFGTCILERFLSTLDYPGRRMILSPRDNPELRAKHLAMLAGDPVEVPFYLWGDHYMFARGGVGQRRDLNFFVDSGLVAFWDDGSGEKKQAAFRARPRDLAVWGVAPDLARKKFIESPLPLSLGPLEQSGNVVQTRRHAAISSLGGVRIDGLLSHAWIKHYCWTIDFREMKYIFQ